jgi:hypothetical protein
MQTMKNVNASFKAWLQKDENRKRAEAFRQHVDKAFLEHPRESNESYGQHLWFTVKMVLRLTYTAAVLLVHGIFPTLFTRTASGQMETIYAIMRSRIPEKRREEIIQDWNDYHV